MRRETEEMHEPGVRLSLRALILLTLLGWLSMIGFDFFLHAGVLTRLYLTPSPFLLPATSAFRLIPVGYLSFLILALILVWLMTRLQITRAWPGCIPFVRKGAVTRTSRQAFVAPGSRRRRKMKRNGRSDHGRNEAVWSACASS